jgi:LysR family transcriptional regulator, hydrogen peroxide-inducible genes activator
MASPHDLSIRQLQYVVAVADTLGFHKAASRCHVSQPTLSAQVQQVESVLDVKLFERSRRGVILTQAGSDIVARARRILVDVDDLLVAATRLHDPFVGTFRVGVIPTVAPYLLPEVMPKVKKKYPHMTLVFREEKTADIVHELSGGAIDAGILALEAEIGDCAHAEIMVDPFVVALPKGHALATKRRVALGDLSDAPVLLLDDGHCLRDQTVALCARARATESGFRATSLGTLAQMVSSGAGITLLPSMAVGVENRRGQLEIRPFVKPAPGRTVALVWRKRSPFSAAFDELARTLREGARGSPL